MEKIIYRESERNIYMTKGQEITVEQMTTMMIKMDAFKQVIRGAAALKKKLS